MKILQLFNQRRVLGGEDRMVEFLDEVLTGAGHEVETWLKSNAGLETRGLAKVSAAVGGIYNLASRGEMASVLERVRPDIVHCHNLYPLFSPSVLDAARDARLPTLVHLHGNLLTCPITTHFTDGKVCDRCLGGHELNCVTHNCRQSLAESVAYAARTAIARKLRMFGRGVTLLTMSEFSRRRLLLTGYDAADIAVIPNAVRIPDAATPGGDYIGFVGRLVEEKGIATLLEAARLTGLPVRIAGGGDDMAATLASAPANVTFDGPLSGAALDAFYAGARFVVVPSLPYETFGLTAAEAMAHGKPVIASDLGALAEIVEHGATGLLVPVADAVALAEAMALLWDSPARQQGFGEASRAKAVREYSPVVYAERVVALYGAMRAAQATG